MSIHSIGGRRPEWERTGYEKYVARLPRHVHLDLIELPLEKSSRNRSPDQTRERECERLLKSLPAGAHVVALDERGITFSSRALAEKLAAWQLLATRIAFMIGGPDGLSDVARGAAAETLSLSKLTLPHGLARIVLAEQLYRAFSILDAHPYHRD